MEDLASASLFPVDVEDREDAYYFIADVPGLEKGDIKVVPCPAYRIDPEHLSSILENYLAECPLPHCQR